MGLIQLSNFLAICCDRKDHAQRCTPGKLDQLVEIAKD
jgi:hypothetical protein